MRPPIGGLHYNTRHGIVDVDCGQCLVTIVLNGEQSTLEFVKFDLKKIDVCFLYPSDFLGQLSSLFIAPVCFTDCYK